jgi:hypothetical protein
MPDDVIDEELVVMLVFDYVCDMNDVPCRKLERNTKAKKKFE